MPRAPSIQLHNIRVTFAGRLLFDALDFSLSGGKLTCLLGASGVGKTTLLRCIAGLGDKPESGTIVTSDGQSLDQRIAWMAQDDLLLPWLNVIDNVALGARLRGGASAQDYARASMLLGRVGLAGKEQQMPATLSGGMRQRVALARTLMEDRPVVLMDEPFAAVDAITRHELQAMASDLLSGKTVLLVTHDPLEAVRVAHTIHVMHGHPAKTGSPLQLTGEPARDPADPVCMEHHSLLLQQLQGRQERVH